MEKRVIIFSLFLLIILSTSVFAGFNMGEPGEGPRPDSITGLAFDNNTVEEGRVNFGYLTFLIMLFLALLAAVIFLFQRVNPDKR